MTLSRTQHQRLAMVLIGGARGDLAFDGNGDVRYGISIDENGKDVHGATGSKLIKVVRFLNGYEFEITPVGCDFLLENLQGGCYSERDRRAMEATIKTARHLNAIREIINS